MKEEKFPCTREPLHWRGQGVGSGESFRAMKESAATGMQRAKWRDSRTEDQCRPALTSPGGRGLGGEARASVGSQEEDWGWRYEHSLKGLVRHS